MINPRRGGAVYRQLADILRNDIQAGRLQPGQRIPSEATLSQQYGLARDTVRRAIAVLRAEGRIVIRKGHGAFVRETTEIADLQPAPGSTVTARMPTAEERADHDLEDGVPVFVVSGPDGAVEVYPADRWQLQWPAP